MNPGMYRGTIKRNSIRVTKNGTEYVLIAADVEGFEFPISVWLTEKAAGMARSQLKACGFDIDKQDLLTLATDPAFLKDREIPVEVFEEEYNGKLQTKARIPTSDGGTSPTRINELQAMLRAAKKKAEEVMASAAEEEEEMPF